MHWPHRHSLSGTRIKILRYFQKNWKLENLHTYRSRRVTDPKFVYPSLENIYRTIGAVLYNWKTPNRMKAGFSLNNTSKKQENTPDWHHTCSYYHFWDIRLQFTSVGSKNWISYICFLRQLTFIENRLSTIQNND